MPRADTQTPTPGKQPPSARLGPREWQLGAHTHARQCQRGNGAGGREQGLATSASSAHLQEPRRGQGVASVCVWGGVGVARLGQRRWHPQALPCDRYFWIVRGPAPATRPKRCFRNFRVGAGLPLPPPRPAPELAAGRKPPGRRPLPGLLAACAGGGAPASLPEALPAYRGQPPSTSVAFSSCRLRQLPLTALCRTGHLLVVRSQGPWSGQRGRLDTVLSHSYRGVDPTKPCSSQPP